MRKILAGRLRRMGRDDNGAVQVLAAVGLTLLLAMAALVLDYARYWVYSAQLQTAADAAALAGATQMWVTQEVDGLGNVYSSNVWIDQFEAEREAMKVLDENLQLMDLTRQGLTVVSKGATVAGTQVTVSAVLDAKGFIAGMFGSRFASSRIRRMATADYVP